MLDEVRELWRFRELLYTMVERELRIRYKNSVLGFFWSLLNPLVTVMVMTFVFRSFVGIDMPNFGAYVFAAYVPFMFFQMSLLDSSQSVIGALPLVRKIYFPREILPLASIIGNFIHFVLALLVLLMFMIAVWISDPRVFPLGPSLIFLPILLLINLAFSTGIALIISALNTFYEDVKYIVSVILYLLFFACPVMYFSEQVLHAYRAAPIYYYLYHLNPVAMLCTAYRKVILAPQAIKQGETVLQPIPLDWGLVGITAVISILTLVIGYAVFNRMKWRFVERP
jgi:ABC-type polysaccharide/polyol phosphate export permease